MLGSLVVGLDIVKTIALAGVWYELHKGRKVQEQILDLQAAQHEERRLPWIAMMFRTWIEAHAEQAGLDFSTTISLRSDLIKAMNALCEHEQMDVPGVLLNMAHHIQKGLSPRVELVFKATEFLRRHAQDLVEEGVVPTSPTRCKRAEGPVPGRNGCRGCDVRRECDCWCKEIGWYVPGHKLTDRWLAARSEGQIKEIEGELETVGFWQRVFGDRASELAGKKDRLQRQQEITSRYKPFQNLINELGSVLYAVRRQQEIAKALPGNKKVEMMLVPETKSRFLGLGRKPVIDRTKGIQKFRLLGFKQTAMQG